MIGRKAVLTKKMAKWFLENPEMYEIPGFGKMVDGWDACVYHSMLVLMGGSIIGTITNGNTDGSVLGVSFKTPFGEDFHYIDRTDVKIISEGCYE